MIRTACLSCPEGKKGFAKIRGLCLKCYQQYHAAVKAGETTWEKLKAEGKAMLTLKELGRRPKSLNFMDHAEERYRANGY